MRKKKEENLHTQIKELCVSNSMYVLATKWLYWKYEITLLYFLLGWIKQKISMFYWKWCEISKLIFQIELQ